MLQNLETANTLTLERTKRSSLPFVEINMGYCKAVSALKYAIISSGILLTESRTFLKSIVGKCW